jgi:diguanylate cyclase (GGDEF)-like protein/PAS domain S-box-containing protein
MQLAVRIAALAAVYVIGARIGLQLAFDNRNVTAVWPPTGIAVAALLLWGIRVWPGIAIGALVANLSNNAGLATSVAITVGNTVAPVAGVYALRSLRWFNAQLTKPRDVAALFGIGGFAAMAMSATLGTLSLELTGATSARSFGSLWLVWWVGDAIGVMLFAPFLVVAARAQPEDPINRRLPHAITLVIFTVGLSLVVFNSSVPLGYLLLIPLVWGALEFEQAGAATVTVVLAVIAFIATVRGDGPFATQTPTRNLLALQLFNATLSFAGLLLASLVFGRNRAEQALRTSEDRYRTLFEKASDFVCVLDGDGRVRYANEAASLITGLPRSRLEALTIEELVRDEDIHIARRALERLRSVSDTTTFEVHVKGVQGRHIALEVSATIVRAGESTVQLIGRDVTARNIVEGQLRRQVLRDPGTGLPNRTLFTEYVEYAIALAVESQTRLAVCVMDVDAFSQVGDTEGPGAADALLRRIAHRITAGLRPSDAAGRLGHDEFGIILTPVSSDSDAVSRAYSLAAELQRSAPDERASVATGVAMFPDHATTGEALLAAANVAMHAAKSAGRGAVELYGPAHAES